MMQIFHECFNARFGDFEFDELFNRMFVNGSSYSSSDSHEGVGFPSVILYTLD